MGVYRASDLVRVPSLLSLSRLPLAAAFPFVLGRPVAALAVLVLAGLSDVADGWYARRYGQVTPTGAAVDPVTDKLFVLTVAVSLVVDGCLAPLDVVLLSTREIAELPLVVWLAASHHARRRRATTAASNVPGKSATVFQFVTAAAALYRVPSISWLVDATALAGGFAAATYWGREIRWLRAERRSEREGERRRG